MISLFKRATAKAQPISPAPDLEAAVAHHHAGRLADAETLYRKVLAAAPDNPDALHLLGVVALQRGNAQEAVDLISQSLAHRPDDPHALNHLGEGYRLLGFLDEAKTCFEKTLALNSDYYQACNNLGTVYQVDGRLEIAMSWFQRAIEIKPNYADAHTNLGNAFQESGHAEAAIACYEKALELRPDFPEASFNLANVYKSLRRYDEAIPRYRKTLQSRPDFVEGHLALARSHQEVGEREEAIASFRTACELQPENPEARWGAVFSELTQVHGDDHAVEDYRAAFARGLRELEDWFTPERASVGFRAVGSLQPFYLAYHEENNRDLLVRYGKLCAQLGAVWQQRERLVLRDHKPNKRVRVGLVSAHVCDHSVWHALIKGWCQHLDPKLVQLDIFYLGKVVDRETEIAKTCTGRFVHGLVRPQQWAQAILAEPLDVLIYPEIGMDAMTAKLASLRLAPVQATTWGHPETSGFPTMDYYLSAADFEPEHAQENYSEKLVSLPNLGCCYHPLDTAREDISVADLGIDARKPIFICPGTPFKYGPQHDWIYTAIARELGPCQFVFFKYPLATLAQQLTDRLSAAFSKAGLACRDYVVEVPWLPKARFNSLMRQSTAFLDTIGFSGFNTAIQAIECGLPVITREGRFLRGRLASGVLKRMTLTELIAPTEQDYVNLAVRMGRDGTYRTRAQQLITSWRNVLYGDPSPVRTLEEWLVQLRTTRARATAK